VKRRMSVARMLYLGIGIYAMWLILSGHYTGFLLTMGLLCSAFVVFIAVRMDLLDEEGAPLITLNSKVWLYIPWFLGEVIKSNLLVARLIIDPRLPISPTLMRFRGRPRTDLGRFILANSITLTPGTITLAITGDDFHVHAVAMEAIDGIEEGEMNRKVAALEKAHTAQ
jgi:multicomponent Na+:H+ antiporter subunit E